MSNAFFKLKLAIGNRFRYINNNTLIVTNRHPNTSYLIQRAMSSFLSYDAVFRFWSGIQLSATFIVIMSYHFHVNFSP